MRDFFDLIIYISTLIGAVGCITGIVVKWLNKKLSQMIEPMKNQIHKMDVKECRRTLIDFLSDLEKGVEKNEVQWTYAHEVYDHYTKDLEENSYVKDFWERVVK
jgi:hypothetical protein